MDTGLPDCASAILPLIEDHTGLVAGVRRTERGFGSDLTAVVEGADGRFFVKAMRNRAGGRRDSLIRERLINASLGGIAPPLLWDEMTDDWLVLGFALIDGRSADFAPASPDLALVVDAIGEIGRLSLPPIAQDWAETRWDRFASDSSEAALFRGDALLHTDINPSNFLVAKGRTWVVDWAWPTKGAAFIDPALLVLQLIAAGHTPASAEEWAERLPAWRTAPSHAIDAFAAANLRMYRAASTRKPDADWLTAMVDACRRWAEHRGTD
ncbi:phosphotransferase [Streptomyces sp. NPDC086091]|uniref:phosphotransferase n=1 Tax=Streptomyces sp. NPDC086091 TaxID=3365751 RepID=UPI00380D5181